MTLQKAAVNKALTQDWDATYFLLTTCLLALKGVTDSETGTISFQSGLHNKLEKELSPPLPAHHLSLGGTEHSCLQSAALALESGLIDSRSLLWTAPSQFNLCAFIHTQHLKFIHALATFCKCCC